MSIEEMSGNEIIMELLSLCSGYKFKHELPDPKITECVTEIKKRLNSVSALTAERDKLKCCGNCSHYTPRGDCRSKHEYKPSRYCDFWTSDGKTQEKRNAGI